MNAIVALALLTAVVSAVRSTWSACGLSVLSTITPQTEQGRGSRWGVTAGFYLVAATVAGTAVGGLAALATTLTGQLSTTAALGVAALLALAATGLDRWRAGRGLPPYRRQLDEDDLVTYRSWVYGTWWGLQVGCGFATISMTAGVALTFGLAALTGSATWALVVGAVFGLTRGLGILPAAGLHDTPRAMALHRMMDEYEIPTRRAMLAWLAGVAAVAATLAVAAPVAVVVASAPLAALLAWISDGGLTIGVRRQDHQPTIA